MSLFWRGSKSRILSSQESILTLKLTVSQSLVCPLSSRSCSGTYHYTEKSMKHSSLPPHFRYTHLDYNPLWLQDQCKRMDEGCSHWTTNYSHLTREFHCEAWGGDSKPWDQGRVTLAALSQPARPISFLLQLSFAYQHCWEVPRFSCRFMKRITLP